MRLSICVHDRRDGEARVLDVALGGVARDATVAELLDVVSRRRPGWLAVPAGRRTWNLDLDGTAVSAASRLSDLPVRAGSIVRLTPTAADGPSPEPAADAVPRYELATVAGPDCGLTLPLGFGTFVLGRTGGAGLGFGPVGDALVRIEVGDDRAVIDAPDPVRVDGESLARKDITEPCLIAPGDAVFALRRAPRLESIVEGPRDAHGRRPLIRTPRVATVTPPAQVPVPQPPAPAATPAPLSWLLLLAPLPIGVVMALVFSPFFLVMTAMTPLMSLARWVEGKYRSRKDIARIAAELANAAARFGADLDASRAVVARTARAAQADLAELCRRATTGRGLWEVRPGDADELRVGLGIGTLPWQPDLGRRGDLLATMPDAAQALTDRAWLVDVPVPVDLAGRTGLGIVGPADIARAAVAAVVIELVTRHGPADLELALLIAPAHLGHWDWAKWLPHLAGDDATPRVATDAETAAALLDHLGDEPAGAKGATGHLVVVIDGDALLTGRVASLLGRLARGRGRALVIASRTSRLPSVCRTFVEVTADGTGTLTDAVTGEKVPNLLTVRAAADVCARTARALAGWTDPEQPAATALLPDRARLVDLLLTAAASPDGLGRPVGALDADTIHAWWRRGAGGLEATIGVTEDGPLTVDLLTDGPHGLVVGTTGAGKSELLRTLVGSLACRYSPDDLTFLLVDFKGGGAFDACAGLPHTVGLVTDLDEHLATRALRCLRAELRHRERRLREAGVSDLRDYLAPSPPLPRLLIVIDEFATLAMELPGFLSALVDVAQRGRSLGIHLLLATQRPQGVVDGKIRSNTNLRVALRVQDDADSRDVLGTRQAADIDRRRPGRAFVRLGAGEIVAVQTALVSAPATPDAVRRIEVAEFRLVHAADGPATPEPTTTATAVHPDGIPTDLENLLAAAVAAAEDYAPPRVPWPAPLPAEVDAWSLIGSDQATDSVPLGLVDLPDEQRSDLWWWRPESGATLVLGAEAEATGAVLAAACLGLARRRHPDRQRVFVLDGVGCGLAELAGLPHVEAAIGVDDTERLSRVLDQLDAEVAQRRAAGAGGTQTAPNYLLVLAGWSALVEGAERAGIADAALRLERLLRDGPPAGVHLLISVPHERAIPGRVFAQIPVKLCLRLADPSSYTGLGLRAREVPDLHGLRALDLQSRHELHIGRYGTGLDAIAVAAAAIAGDYPGATPSTSVGVLPELIPAAEVLGASAISRTTWRLGIGRHYQNLTVATLALSPGMHAVVAGPPGSGRTTALRVLAAAALSSVPSAAVRVVTADPDGWDLTGVSDVVSSIDGLPGWDPSGRGLLLVDGIETLGHGAAQALDRLIPALPAAVHCVVAGRPDVFRGMQPWQRAVTLSRTGLLLRPSLDDGDILRIRLPRDTPPRPVPGRGYLVEAGGLAQVQVALPPQVRVTAPGALGMAMAAIDGAA